MKEASHTLTKSHRFPNTDNARKRSRVTIIPCAGSSFKRCRCNKERMVKIMPRVMEHLYYGNIDPNSGRYPQDSPLYRQPNGRWSCLKS